MDENKPLQAGDPCPRCGGEMVPDQAHDPTAIADMKEQNLPDHPDWAHSYRRQVDAKAKKFGVIHRCVRCGYQARYPTSDGGGGGARQGGASSSTAAGEGSDGLTSAEAEAARAGEIGARGTSSAARVRQR